MIRKKVWRYYCEHCGKAGCSGGHIKRHEYTCTKNPNRVCGMCHVAGNFPMPMEFLKRVVNRALVDAERERKSKGLPYWMSHHFDNDHVIDALETATDSCPACILAAIVQTGIGFITWQFSEAKTEFWKNYPREEYRGPNR